MNIFRRQFSILSKKINGKPLIYFDSASTSQKPKSVIGAIKNFYEKSNSNVHRSFNPLGEESTELYEGARKKIASFVGAKNSREIIFTRNTTESINLVAKTWGSKHLRAGDRVLLSIAEHHSNIVPWLQLKKEKGIFVEYIPLRKDLTLDANFAKNFLKDKKTKLLSIAHASNVLGGVHPVEELIACARERNITTLVDAAQSVAHILVDVGKLGCDFLAFSGHKMFGPTGIGVLWGRDEMLQTMPEFLGGGEMVLEVSESEFTTKDIPSRYEAGTPHISGAVGISAAIDFILNVGLKKISGIEKKLWNYLFHSLCSVKFATLYTSPNSESHLPLLSFSIHGIHSHDIADILGEQGICIRAGHHCAMPLHKALGVSATARVSLSVYNTREEIDVFIEALKEVYRKFQ